MICDTCIFLEIFGKKGVNEFWNKCALLDIWNLEEGDECEYCQPAGQIQPVESDNQETVMI